MNLEDVPILQFDGSWLYKGQRFEKTTPEIAEIMRKAWEEMNQRLSRLEDRVSIAERELDDLEDEVF